MKNFRGYVFLLLGTLLAVSIGYSVRARSQNASTQNLEEAPTGFDNLTNGSALQGEMDKGHAQFIQVEAPAPDGLGPLFNAVSCVDCHQNIADGGGSQVRELRAGHSEQGQFVGATITLGDGKTQIGPRSLINQRAICTDALGQLSAKDNIRALRMSLPLFGDAFVEAVDDKDLMALAEKQYKSTGGRVHGQAVMVPIAEGSGTAIRVGRFGWKDQQASLLSFASDAYLNEMGITNPFNRTEVTSVCNPPVCAQSSPTCVTEPNNTDDIFAFTTFMRALKAPPRDTPLENSMDAKVGAVLFDQAGCTTCHVPNLQTVPPDTKLNDGTYTVSAAIGNKVFHPYGDFLLHNIGTGDGIVQGLQSTRNKVRTMPLWGLRARVEFLHDGRAHDLNEAIRLHDGEAEEIREKFERLSPAERNQVLTFLKSL
jgi:CxxC motif-containing protein (DUF1111 family)